MRRVISVDRWGAALLAALGLVACGGKTNATGPGGTAGTSGGGTSGGAGAGAGAGDGGHALTFPCKDPQPIVVAGVDTGYDKCAGGFVRRRAIVACPGVVPTGPACNKPDAGSTCTTNTDCTQKANGYCGPDFYEFSCVCYYACTTDADCGPGKVCLCGAPSRCVPSTCTSDASCGKGLLCSSYTTDPICGGTGFSCQTAGDDCASDSDCATGSVCGSDGTHHRCVPVTGVCGRPFLVHAAARVATSAARGDWLEPDIAPRLDGLSPERRAELARHWTRVGLMEHASVAAFARFALELLSLGAPPGLVERTHAALADETRHARFAFALASAYAERSIGPGALDMTAVLDDASPRAVFERLVREGCIGETVAALEAAEAREHATDPAVRAVLETIARDETRHAELAWRTLSWALGSATLGGAARDALELVFAAPSEVAGEPDARSASELLANGVVNGAFAVELRRDALERAVRPCALALRARDAAAVDVA